MELGDGFQVPVRMDAYTGTRGSVPYHHWVDGSRRVGADAPASPLQAARYP